MKKSRVFPILIVLALIGTSIWLLRGVDAKHLTRQEVIIDVADTFEK